MKPATRLTTANTTSTFHNGHGILSRVLLTPSHKAFVKAGTIVTTADSAKKIRVFAKSKASAATVDIKDRPLSGLLTV